MGDRVLMQVVNNEGTFGPVVYGHDAGIFAPLIAKALVERMEGRGGCVTYWSARLVQEVSKTCSGGNLGLGMWNAEAILTEDDSHGDAGVVIINASTGAITYEGGYYDDHGNFNNGDFKMTYINEAREKYFPEHT